MLTPLATVKARLKIDQTDTADDTLLTNFIKAVSARVEKDCHRHFERTAGATYEFRADEMNPAPDRPPLETVAKFEVKDDETESWIEQTGVAYLLSPTRTLVELAAPLGTARQRARVTYTGGYVLPGATAGPGQQALPDDLEQAVVEQVACLYQNRHRLGLLSRSGEGGTVTLPAQLDLLPAVKATLRHHERCRY